MTMTTTAQDNNRCVLSAGCQIYGYTQDRRTPTDWDLAGTTSVLILLSSSYQRSTTTTTKRPLTRGAQKCTRSAGLKVSNPSKEGHAIVRASASGKSSLNLSAVPHIFFRRSVGRSGFNRFSWCPRLCIAPWKTFDVTLFRWHPRSPIVVSASFKWQHGRTGRQHANLPGHPDGEMSALPH